MGSTITEKILAKASGQKSVAPGDNIWVNTNVLMTHDVCGPGMIKVFKTKFGENARVWDADRIVIIPDHYLYTADQQAHKNIETIRAFAKEQGIKHFYDVGAQFNYNRESLGQDYMGVCHVGLAEAGHNRPGEVLFGTDSHTCTSGAFGTFATGIGDADAALICGIGKLWLKVPETMKFVVEGELPPYVLAKDLILRFIGDIGVGGATYRAMEFAGDAIWNLSVEEKMTICNMAIEAGGKNGIIEPTQEVIDFVKKRSPIPFEIMKSDHDAKYSFTKHYRAKDLVPAVAKPHSPDNYAPAEDLKDVKITRSYIGSCTGGKTEDFVAAAKILYNQKVKVPTFIVPATVKVESDLRTLTYEGKTLKQIFQDAGCEEPLAPGCQACLGGPKDTAGRANTAEVVVSTTNRNFIGRMGSKEAQIFLASPFTAAASAVNGFITDPRRFL